MVPFSERRHRILGPEVSPVVKAVRIRLRYLIEARRDFEEAYLLFRVLYRMESHSPGRPDYPEPEWVTMEAYLTRITAVSPAK